MSPDPSVDIMDFHPIDGRGLIKPERAERAGSFRKNEPPLADVLSRREKQVVAALAEGGGHMAAAERLKLSPLTVKSHLARIRVKLRRLVAEKEVDVGETAGIVFLCLHEGWIE